ncbi:MAG: hypothetical protein II922_12685 [Succinimonas sp.]|nr:hypothetical protein [Succinimonas sp.]
MTMPISGFNPTSFAAAGDIGDVDPSKKTEGAGDVKDPDSQVPPADKNTEKESATLTAGKYTDAATQYAALNDFVSATGKLLAMINEMATKDRQMNKEIIRQQYDNVHDEAMAAADKMREGATTSLIMGIVGGAVQIASGAFSMYSSVKNLSAQVEAQKIQGPAAEKFNAAQAKVDNLEKTGELGNMNKDLKDLGDKVSVAEKARDQAKLQMEKAGENLSKVKEPTAEQIKDFQDKAKAFDKCDKEFTDLKGQYDAKNAEITKFKSENADYKQARQELIDASTAYKAAKAQGGNITALNQGRQLKADGVNQLASATANITRSYSEYNDSIVRAEVKEKEANEASLRAAIEGLKEVNDSLRELSSKARETVQEISRSETDALRKILTV